MRLVELLRARVPATGGRRVSAATPARGPRWVQPVRPALTRLVAAPLLLTGALLLTASLLVLPRGAGTWVGWAFVGALLVNAAVVWRAPLPSRVADLAAAVATVTAAAAITLSTLLASQSMHAWAILLGVPVLYAASMFRRAVAVVATVLSGLGGTAVLLLASTGQPRIQVLVDLALICSCLVILAVFVVHGMEHMAGLVAELERVAAVDGLTGLVTRRVLDDALTDSLATAVGAALVIVDLDHFKDVNDVHGHPAGDAALQHVAGALSDAVRSTDAVVSRLGGDELAVLLPGCPVEVARFRADDLVRAVRDAPLVLADGTVLALTISVGVALAPEHADDVRTLYAVADAALYAAKHAGRDGFVMAAAPTAGG